jgi:hypothetical protein
MLSGRRGDKTAILLTRIWRKENKVSNHKYKLRFRRGVPAVSAVLLIGLAALATPAGADTIHLLNTPAPATFVWVSGTDLDATRQALNAGSAVADGIPPCPIAYDGCTEPTTGPGGVDYGQASANFGQLGVLAIADNGSLGTSVYANAIAEFADFVHYDFPGDGSGYLRITASERGSIETQGDGLLTLTAMDWGIEPWSCAGRMFEVRQQSASCSLELPVQLGVASSFFLDLQLFAGIESSPENPGGGIVDLSHTGWISSVVLEDAAHNDIGSTFLVGDTGTIYGADAPAPEPGAGTLVGLGLAMVAVGYRRARRQPSGRDIR